MALFFLLQNLRNSSIPSAHLAHANKTTNRNKPKTMKKSKLYRVRAQAIAGAAVLTVVAFGLTGALAQKATVPTTPAQKEQSALEEWWNGKYMTGNWFGLRDELKDRGLTLGGKYDGALFGVIDSQRGSRGFWDQQIGFNGKLNFGELLDVDVLKTISAFGEVRWRDDRPRSNDLREVNPNYFVQGSGLFNPTAWAGGVQWRLLNFGLQITSEDYLPIKDMLVLKGGWLQPTKDFIDQPLSKLFLNNAIQSAKGIGGNIPFSGSFSTWGGVVEAKPIDWAYTKAGFYLAYPRATDSGNHGLAFEGFAADPSKNGLMVMAEGGITPKLGPAELPGKYAFGGYYWGNEKPSFNGTYNWGQYGFYWQFDQMLYREPAPSAPEPVVHSKGSKPTKSSKDYVPPAPKKKAKKNDQGLSTFNLITFAPKYNNTYPFYFHSGLVYKGLIPGRDDDQAMFALAYGNYSYLSNLARRERGRAWQDYTMLLEWGYRFKINGWAFLQPFAQYVIRPNGTDHVENATILGFYTGVNF